MDECILTFEAIDKAFKEIAKRREETNPESAQIARTYVETIHAAQTNAFRRGLVRHFEDIVSLIFKTSTQLETCRHIHKMKESGSDLMPILTGSAPVVLSGDNIKNAWGVVMEALLVLSARCMSEDQDGDE